MYKVAIQCGVNLHSKDDSNLLSRGNSFEQNGDRDFACSAESESYKSLPDRLSALSFRASSLPGTRSLDDIHNSHVPDHFTDNPFAAALGIEDTSIGSIAASSSAQMPEGASGLSLTGESFAALNKNSVSALMEYSQSRHVSVDIKCIGSFGPPHRPVYVSKI